MAFTFSQWLKAGAALGPRLLQHIILEKFKVVGMALLGLGLVGVVAAFVVLIWLAPRAISVEPLAQPERGLNVAFIDELELWIEEVEAGRRAGLPLPPRPMFVIDDLPSGP